MKFWLLALQKIKSDESCSDEFKVNPGLVAIPLPCSIALNNIAGLFPSVLVALFVARPTPPSATIPPNASPLKIKVAMSGRNQP